MMSQFQTVFIAVFFAFVALPTAGVHAASAISIATKIPKIGKIPVKEARSAEEFQALKAQVLETEKLDKTSKILKDESLLVEQGDHVMIVRPPGVVLPDASMKLARNDELFTASLEGEMKVPEMDKAKLSKFAWSDASLERVSHKVGNHRMGKEQIWDSLGNLHHATMHTPNLQFVLTTSGLNGKVHVIFQQTFTKFENGMKRVKPVTVSSDKLISLKPGDRLYDYEIDAAGNLKLYVKNSNGQVDPVTVALKEQPSFSTAGAAKSPTGARGNSSLAPVGAVK